MVKLVSHSPDPVRNVARAARLCTTDADLDALEEQLTDEYAVKLVGKLAAMGHWSPFEHANFTFIAEVSRACTHQLVRHRIASYSQQSQRYVQLNEACLKDGFPLETLFVFPPTVVLGTKAHAIFSAYLRDCVAVYFALIKLGIPKEDARFVLPNAIKARIQYTMNARALHNFFKLRCDYHAQWEIRELAVEMRRLVRVVAAPLFPAGVCGDEGLPAPNEEARWKA